MAQELVSVIEKFFQDLAQDPKAKEILGRMDQKVQFRLRDGEPMFIDIKDGLVKVKKGEVKVKGDFDSGVTRLDTDRQTLLEIFEGRMRFADAIIPTRYDWDGGLKMVENWMLKWGVMNWLGVLIRMGQQKPCLR